VKTVIRGCLLLGFVALACTPCAAQEGAIVVLDVAKVFKDNPGFNQKIEAIQQQAQKLKADVEASQQQLRAEAQSMSEKFTAGSPERKTAEAELEQKMTSLRTYARQSEGELMQQEANVYFETYQQMQKVVNDLATQYKLALVLRFDSSPINPDESGSVDRAMAVAIVNRAIVFQLKSDITDEVIKRMPAAAIADSGAVRKQ
jgi:Skp family chaperone for outer membrane proteins